MHGDGWILWDGDCAFCARCAAWTERRDSGNRFRVVRYQDAPAPPMTPELRRRAQRSVLLVQEDGSVLAGGLAVLTVLQTLSRDGALAAPWFWRLMGRRPFVWKVELGYRLVAANRGRIGRLLFRGKGPACRG